MKADMLSACCVFHSVRYGQTAEGKGRQQKPKADSRSQRQRPKAEGNGRTAEGKGIEQKAKAKGRRHWEDSRGQRQKQLQRGVSKGRDGCKRMNLEGGKRRAERNSPT